MIATVVWSGARLPGIDPWASFNDGSLRGPVILFRGLVAFDLGILVGAVMGRQLPAIIVAGLLTIVVVGVSRSAIQNTPERWRSGNRPSGSIGNVDMVFNFAFRDRATGEILAYDVAYSRAPSDPRRRPRRGLDRDPLRTGLAGRLRDATTQVAGLEWLLLGGVAVLSLGLCVFVVDRRRPS